MHNRKCKIENAKLEKMKKQRSEVGGRRSDEPFLVPTLQRGNAYQETEVGGRRGQMNPEPLNPEP